MKSTVYIYVTNTMADWEIGYLTAELNTGRFYKKGAVSTEIVTVGLDRTPIKTMGGLTILPDLTLSECQPKQGDALILPGGNTWMETMHEPILDLAAQCMENDIVVGAICGATMALAQRGLFNNLSHTSNDLEYLKMICPHYQGEAHYISEPAVASGKLITASGTAPLEFAMEVLRALKVWEEDTLENWYQFNLTHESKYFHALMSSMM